MFWLPGFPAAFLCCFKGFRLTKSKQVGELEAKRLVDLTGWCDGEKESRSSTWYIFRPSQQQNSIFRKRFSVLKNFEFHVLDVSIFVMYLVNRLYNLFRQERVKNKTTTKSLFTLNVHLIISVLALFLILCHISLFRASCFAWKHRN